MREELITLPTREVHWLHRVYTTVTSLISENPALERLFDDEYVNVDPEMVSDFWEMFLDEIPYRISVVTVEEFA